MTRIVFQKRGLRYIAQARGHATRGDGRTADPTEGVQVCAAITACMDTLGAGVCVLADRHRAFGVEVSAAEGEERVSAAGAQSVKALFGAVYFALHLLSQRYPERLSVEAGQNFSNIFRFS